jgi:phosphate transport system substrate-binding protein
VGILEQYFAIVLNQMRKISIVILGTIALIGLSSCAVSPRTGSSTRAAPRKSPVQAGINVGSSSSTIDFLRTLKPVYEAMPQSPPLTLLEPGQSENIVAGVKQGLIDVGAISRTLKPEEQDATLTYRAIVQDALLIATHPSVAGVKNLTTQELRAIYGGRITNWQKLGGPDAAIVVLDRPEDESAKRLLRQHYLGADGPNAPNSVVLRKEGDLIQTIQSTPYSIGAFSLAYAISHNLPVTRLSLNGIQPTSENLKTGKYPMARTIGIVWRKNAIAPAQTLVQYISSQSGTQTLVQAGFAPLSAPPKK